MKNYQYKKLQSFNNQANGLILANTKFMHYNKTNYCFTFSRSIYNKNFNYKDNIKIMFLDIYVCTKTAYLLPTLPNAVDKFHYNDLTIYFQLLCSLSIFIYLVCCFLGMPISL